MSRFGSPNHDNIWFEDKSLSFPNGAHFDNLRNEIRAWREHVLANGIYPCFTPWASVGLTTDSEDDMGSIIQVSDPESESEARSLWDEETDDSKVAQNYNMNKRGLETLWKLYRNIGETVEDTKIRLVDSLLSEKSDKNDFSENEIESCDSSITSEERMDKQPNDVRINIKSKFSTFDDLLDIQLEESNKNIQLSDIHDDIDIQDWSFKTSIWQDLRNSESNCKYDVPRLKQITKEELVFEKKSISRKKRSAKVDDEDVKRINEPIICDMYGTRTINYNSTPPKVKISDCFKTSRLSDSSCDEEIELIENKDYFVVGKKKKSTSILKNRFRNNNKRNRTEFTLNLSSDSEDSAKRKQIKIFDEKFDTSSTSSISSTCTRSSCSCSSCSSTLSPSEVEN